jgi:TRAP-type C4-dicarboxylate transport system permease small subunit
MGEKRSLVLKVWFGANSVQGVALFLLMMGVMLLVFVQVVLRYVLHAPLMGIEELLLFPTIWLYMIGGASASWERTHISCGILTLYIKRPTSMAIFNIVKGIISVVVSAWLLYWAFWYFRYSLRVMKESATLYIPLVFGESALFFGLLLMTIYTAVELGDGIITLRRKDNPATEEEKR